MAGPEALASHCPLGSCTTGPRLYKPQGMRGPLGRAEQSLSSPQERRGSRQAGCHPVPQSSHL